FVQVIALLSLPALALPVSTVKVDPIKAADTAIVKNLRALKKAELSGSFAECTRAQKALWKDTGLRGWVALSYLRCAARSDKNKKAGAKSDILAPHLLIDANADLLAKGPWSGILSDENLKTRVAWLEMHAPKGHDKVPEMLTRLLGL